MQRIGEREKEGGRCFLTWERYRAAAYSFPFSWGERRRGQAEHSSDKFIAWSYKAARFNPERFVYDQRKIMRVTVMNEPIVKYCCFIACNTEQIIIAFNDNWIVFNKFSLNLYLYAREFVLRFDDLWMIDILSGCQIHSGDFDDEKVTSFLPDREFVMPPVTREGGNDAEELFTRENSIEKCVEKLVGIWISRLLLFLTVDFYPLMGYRIEFKRNASWRNFSH